MLNLRETQAWIKLCPNMPDTMRLRWLAIAGEDLDRRINKRARIAEQLVTHAVNGKIFVEVWQRDCDCVEFTRMYEIEATGKAYDELLRDTNDGAEGPYSLSILTKAEAEAFKPTSRDRVLEAFENGSSYLV